MADTDAALQAAIKALSEVVGPAVDPADALAVDQLRLVISWLHFHGQRRGDGRRLAWAALRQRIAMARDAASAVQGSALGPVLEERCAAAQALLERADAPTADWCDGAQALDAEVCAAVDALADGPAGPRHALAKVVLTHSRDVLMLQRAWFAPLGFEARPAAVPALEQWLADAPPP